MAEPMDLSDAALFDCAELFAAGAHRWTTAGLRDEIARSLRAIRDAATAAEREGQRMLLEYLETAGPRRVDGIELCMLCEGKPHSADCEIGAAQIRLMREEAASGQSATARLFVELADEALARGKAATIEKMKREATEGIAQQMAQEYDALRERVAQLETALRDQANWIKSDGSGCWCANTSVCKNDPWCREARAALAAGKP